MTDKLPDWAVEMARDSLLAQSFDQTREQIIATALVEAERRGIERAAEHHDDLVAQHTACREGEIFGSDGERHHGRMVRLHRGYAAAIRKLGESE